MSAARVHVRERLAYPPGPLFRDRADAGRALVEYVAPAPDPAAVVFGLPRGGLPTGRPLADALGCRLLPVLVRKLPIPSNPEMGFGAVTVDGTVRLNEPVVRMYGIRPGEVDAIVRGVQAEVRRRAAVYPGGWPLPPLAGRDVWLVDDGLATGLSMLAAAEMVRAQRPAALRLAVPCSPIDSLARLAESVDEAWCLALQQSRSFAVASFYEDFHDLSDAEVTDALRAEP